MHSYFWADYTSVQLQALINTHALPPANDDSSAFDALGYGDSNLVAVLPLGATEQHGPHLPLSTDSSIVDAVIAAAMPCLQSANTPVLFLPTQRIGLSPEHTAFTGTLSLSSETCMQLWKEIGASVADAGISKLLLFNAHGGNAALMDVVARQLRVETGMFTAHSSWQHLPLGDAASAFTPEEWRYGIHAGAIETSIMKHIQPQHVLDEQVKNFPSTSQWRTQNTTLLGDGKSCKLGWAMQDYNREGAAGDATQASAEKGKALIENAGASLAALLAEMCALRLKNVMA